MAVRTWVRTHPRHSPWGGQTRGTRNSATPSENWVPNASSFCAYTMEDVDDAEEAELERLIRGFLLETLPLHPLSVVVDLSPKKISTSQGQVQCLGR